MDEWIVEGIYKIIIIVMRNDMLHWNKSCFSIHMGPTDSRLSLLFPILFLFILFCDSKSYSRNWYLIPNIKINWHFCEFLCVCVPHRELIFVGFYLLLYNFKSIFLYDFVWLQKLMGSIIIGHVSQHYWLFFTRVHIYKMWLDISSFFVCVFFTSWSLIPPRRIFMMMMIMNDVWKISVNSWLTLLSLQKNLQFY